MEVLVERSGSPVKSAYKIKKRDLIPKLENRPKLESSSILPKITNPPLETVNKRLATKFLDESVASENSDPNHSGKSQSEKLASSLTRKRLHTSKDGFVRPMPPTPPNIKPPTKEEAPKNCRPSQKEYSNKTFDAEVRKPNHRRNFNRENNKLEGSDLRQKVNELYSFPSQNRESGTSIGPNIDEFIKNKLKYLPNIQLKVAKFGNHIIPVLPSFLVDDI